MVEDTIEDPKRIAELLSSELTGLETGPLAAVEVVDADRSATPSPEGTGAYAIAFANERVGRVRLYPDIAVVELSTAAEIDDLPVTADVDGLTVESTEETLHLSLSTGVAVKRAVDVVRSVLVERSGPS